MADKQIRKPKQKRSIDLKEKILETALKLFCEKGYFQTTTNEIAKAAGVSIGSLYSYFKDKDTIFLEILEHYHQQFVDGHNDFLCETNDFKSNKKEWFHKLIERLIEVHEASKELNKEIAVLSYYIPWIAAIREKQNAETEQIITKYFLLFKEDIIVDDIEAAAIIVLDFISAIVDRIVFEKSNVSRERILKTGIDALDKILFK